MRVVRRMLVVMLAALVLALLPPVQSRLKGIGVLMHALGKPWFRPFAATIERKETTIGNVRGDLYTPGRPAPALVLVHGAAAKGKDDPRLVRLARSITKADRVVFVPDLELKNKRFVRADVERIVQATAALREIDAVSGGVQLLGFSYGGSFAMIAAADERIAKDVIQVATFGAYFDLVGYIQAITTKVSIVEGRRIAWDPDPRAEEVLFAVGARILPPRDRPELDEALAGRAAPDGLSSEAQALYRLLTNDDPERTYDLAERLPARARRTLEEFSPSSIFHEIEAEVIVMHSDDDPAVPYAEALRMKDALSRARLVTVTLFRHVDLVEGGRAGLLATLKDFFDAWRFTSWVLASQEDFF